MVDLEIDAKTFKDAITEVVEDLKQYTPSEFDWITGKLGEVEVLWLHALDELREKADYIAELEAQALADREHIEGLLADLDEMNKES